MKRYFLMVGLVVAGLPLAAQDVVFSMAATDLCLQVEETAESCIGASAQVCMEDSAGGYSTVGTGACLEAEWQAWDARLNSAYGVAMEHSKAMDRENGAYGPSQAEALREMQRAWIPYRDRKCDYERSQWGGGTGGGPASLYCLMVETGRQTLYLQATLAEG